MTKDILEARHISLDYISTERSLKKVIHAVKDVSFEVKQGEVFSIAGESGCGKSSLAKVLIRLLKPSKGIVYFKGKDISKFDKSEMQNFTHSVQMVFQNPYHSLNPKMKIIDILKEPLDINTSFTAAEKKEIIDKIMSDIGLSIEVLKNYPHEFSGGQLQRIAIAKALILKPEIIIADEPVSALDASIQAHILNLLSDLKQKYNLTIIFISHDLRVIKYLSNRVGIMYMGELEELGTVDDIFNNPKHPYTKALLSAIPSIGKPKPVVLREKFSAYSDYNKTAGCSFKIRCAHYTNDKCCSAQELMPISKTHSVRCNLYCEEAAASLE